MTSKEYLNAIEDAFWAGYNARQKQLDISMDNVLNVGYQRQQISERDILAKVLEEKKNDV